MSKKTEDMQDDQDKWQQFAEKQNDETLLDEDVLEEMQLHDEEDEPAAELGIAFDTREKLEEELNALEAKVEAYKSQTLRAHAEMENLRVRVARDIQNAHKYGTEKLLSDLLPAVDSLVCGLEEHAQATGEAKAMAEGMQLTLDILMKALHKQGVTLIDPEKGTVFNPEMHEAMSMQPIPGAKSNTIVEVLQKGFELNGRVLRAARVIVAS